MPERRATRLPAALVPRLALSLFWRTFVLLSLLLCGGILAWMQTFRALEFEPNALQAAQQVASLVSLSRAALQHADGIHRVMVLKTMRDQDSIKVVPREPGDRFEAFETDRFTQAVGDALRSRLGPDTVVARSVNGTPGLWVGFSLGGDPFWLQSDRERVQPVSSETYFAWTGIALIATLLGSAVIAGLINRPLKQLSFAASRIREGEFDSRLDEDTLTSEVREVNKGFNRMARELAKVEEDRAVMLAGISHDLRTPLARMRLEAEMSIADEEAKRNMAADIDQLDAIIDKFMDYARPGAVKLSPTALSGVIEREVKALRDPDRIRVESRVSPDVSVMADEIELGRVIGNLFENARRYGLDPESGLARVLVTQSRSGPWVTVSVRDFGPGVPAHKLPALTLPFFRGDAARTAATGAGLGLTIAEKAVQRMGGSFEVLNAEGGGLEARLRLRGSAAH